MPTARPAVLHRLTPFLWRHVNRHGRSFRAVDHHPGRDLGGMRGPFDVGDRDLAIGGLPDHAQHCGVGDGGGIALPLEADLGGRDRAGGIGKKDKLDLDLIGKEPWNRTGPRVLTP